MQRLCRLFLPALIGFAFLSSAPVAADDSMRSAWPAPAQGLRQWEAAPASSPASMAVPTPTTPYQRTEPYGDVFNVSEVVGPASDNGYLARTHIESANDRSAVLTVTAGGSFRLWVNGALMGSYDGGAAFGFSPANIPVSLTAGTNEVLLHVDGGPLSVQVSDIGITNPDSPPVMALSTSQDSLTLRIAPHPLGVANKKTRVDAISANGKVIASASSVRGGQVTFQTAQWPEGAYEFRAETSNGGPYPQYAYVSYYKGDLRAAVTRLLAEAVSAPATPQGDHLRLLTAIAQGKLGDPIDAASPDALGRTHNVIFEYEALKAGLPHAAGLYRIAYTDNTDGSTQFCRAYLPVAYDPKAKTPLVVYLHGFNPANPPMAGWWDIDNRHELEAERRNVVWLAPHGRGNAQYRGIGERDVLRCVDEAQRRFSIDPDRVYLTGESMGGAGTWLISSRHAERFAAASPVYAGWDYRLTPQFVPDFSNPKATRASEQYRIEAHTSFAEAEGLIDVPVYVHHGDADNVNNVVHSRHPVHMLSRWGYNVRYREHEGGRHDDLGVRGEIIDWLLTHKRGDRGQRARMRSMGLAGADAGWLKVTQWQSPYLPIRVAADWIAPDHLSLRTENVAEIEIAPTTDQKDVTVNWNGKLHQVPFAETITLRADGVEKSDGPRKTSALPGSLSDAFNTPFVIVVGTASADPALNTILAEKAESLAGQWQAWQHVRPRLITDRDLSADDMAQYTLILFGDASSNLISRRLESQLGVSATPQSVSFAGQTFAATEAVAQVLRPHPLNADRYALVIVPTSASALRTWSGNFWNPVFGFPTNLFDFIISDNKLVMLEVGRGPEHGWVAAGVFAPDWTYDERWMERGDEAVRAAASRREYAPPSAIVSGDYVGRYDVAPGVSTTIAEVPDGLSLTFMQDPPITLLPENTDAFAITTSNGLVRFERDDAGKVIAWTLWSDGQITRAKRVP